MNTKVKLGIKRYNSTKVIEYDIIRGDIPVNSVDAYYMLDNKGGVCASYAYLTNVLLRKAGIESYEITSDSHAWNVIELDGKYYYLDGINASGMPDTTGDVIMANYCTQVSFSKML